MKAITLRGISEDIYERIRQLSKDQHVSMNKFIVGLLQNQTGKGNSRAASHGDFDQFIGSWSEEDYRQFNQSLKDMHKIDREMWK